MTRDGEVLGQMMPVWPDCPEHPGLGVPAGILESLPTADLLSHQPRQRKAQITCTAIFIVWGVLVHLVIPPFVFMVTEEWNYIEGLYYSFITITTIGFGDFVAGESLSLSPDLCHATISFQSEDCLAPDGCPLFSWLLAFYLSLAPSPTPNSLGFTLLPSGFELFFRGRDPNPQTHTH